MNEYKFAFRAVSAPLLMLMLAASVFTQGNAAKSISAQQSSMSKPSGTIQRDERLWQRALKLHRSATIVDGHNDIPSPMVDDDFNLATDSVGKFHKDGDPFHTDLARFKKSGITGEFFSIYVSGQHFENRRRDAASVWI